MSGQQDLVDMGLWLYIIENGAYFRQSTSAYACPKIYETSTIVLFDRVISETDVQNWLTTNNLNFVRVVSYGGHVFAELEFFKDLVPVFHVHEIDPLESCDLRISELPTYWENANTLMLYRKEMDKEN